MSLKKVIVTIVLILFALFIGFCGLLYYTLRTKAKDLSEQIPFTTFIDKEIYLYHDAILVKNYEPFVYQEPLYLGAVDSQLSEDTSIAYKLQKGDVIIFKAAKNFTNGVSGFTNTILIGEITTGNPKNTIPFEYDWEGDEIFKTNQNQLMFTLKWDSEEKGETSQ